MDSNEECVERRRKNIEYEKMLKETHESVLEIRTVLLGPVGAEERGLCYQMKILEKEHAKLKQQFWMLVAFMIGSEIITGTILSLIK